MATTTTTTIKMYVQYDNFTDAEIANSSEFEAAVEEEVENRLRDLDTIYDVLGEFEHSFADLLTAEGEERENLVAELLALFRKKARESLLEGEWTEVEVTIPEHELLEALRALPKTARGDLAIKIAAL